MGLPRWVAMGPHRRMGWVAMGPHRRMGWVAMSGVTTWDAGAIADELALAIGAAEQALTVEQAAHGLDVLDERALQDLLAAALARTHEGGREGHYPSSRGKKLSHRK